MPLNRPILDNRSYQQLRDELIARIPVYAPEWTDHNPSDPGVTLVELFAYLGENLLFQFNQIPDATYMEFLRLLQVPLRPAEPARTLLEFSTEKPEGVLVPIGSVAKAGDLPFETRGEVRVLPVTALACCKAEDERPDAEDDPDAAEWFDVALGLLRAEDAVIEEPSIEVAAAPTAELADTDFSAYTTTRLGPDDEPVLDLDQAVDRTLWVAVLAADADSVPVIRQSLGEHAEAPLLLNLGFVPDIRLDEEELVDTTRFVDLTHCPGEGAKQSRYSVQWEIETGSLSDGGSGEPVYRPLALAGDTTEGLSREGVVRLSLPSDLKDLERFPLSDASLAGTGERPPLLDDDLDERVIFWLRAYRLDDTSIGQVVHLGANDALALQSRAATTELLGTGTGQPGQAYGLVHRQVLSGSLALQVEEAGGWTDWSEVGSLHASGESDRHYLLDAEAGRVSFGNALRGRVPQIGERIRVLGYRYGGGDAGNVVAGAVSKISSPAAVDVSNPLAAYGGADAEELVAALDRIPGELRRRDRAVTRGDFAELALATPGADIGRAECLPLRAPDRPGDSAGAVSVVIWPRQDPTHPDAPLPDRNQIGLVCRWLDARRLVTTELYVRPPRYRKIALAVGVAVEEGSGIDAVRRWVELVLRQFLAPLPPYGPAGNGWPLGRRVLAAELEATVLQVEGVDFLHMLKLKDLGESDNTREITLDEDEVVELAAISVEQGEPTVEPGEGLSPPGETKPSVPIPIIREEC